MLRVCGAEIERDSMSARRCWCGGLFCGKGGYRQTRRFRRAFHTAKTARTRVEFLDLIAQADLFDNDLARDAWLALIAQRPVPKTGKGVRRCSLRL